MEQNQSEIKEEMVENQSEYLFALLEIAQNQRRVPNMVEQQLSVGNEEQCGEKSSINVNYEEDYKEQTNMVEEIKQQLFVGDEEQCGEKSSINVKYEEHHEEQKKDKVFRMNVEDATICKKESLNTTEKSVSVKLENLEQEPLVDDVNNMVNANSVGNYEYNEEEDIEKLISGFEIGCFGIKQKIIDSKPEELKQELSEAELLGGDSEDSKKEIMKCLVNSVYKCLTCSEAFFSKESQEQHECTTPYRCLICMEVLTNEPDLNEHMSCHKNEPCRICGKTFKSTSRYLKHLKAHSGIGHKCMDCGEVFASYPLVKIHRRKHIGEKPYICEYCGKTFVVNQSYETHLKQHTGKKSFECHTCLKKFPQKTTLHNHIRIHSGERPYVCVICGNCFRDPGGLWRHTRKAHTQKAHTQKAHTQKESFKCHLCTRKYPNNAELEAHLSRHAGIRPYECHLCGKKYMNKACLPTHIKMHENEEYNSAVCRKKFESVLLKDRHIRTHKVNTYSCATCDETFLLRRHIIRHVLKFQH